MNINFVFIRRRSHDFIAHLGDGVLMDNVVESTDGPS